MAKRRHSRRRSYSGFGETLGEVFSEGFGALPALLALPLVKYALVGGAAYYVLKKKPNTMASQLVDGQAPLSTSRRDQLIQEAFPAAPIESLTDIMGREY